VALFGIEKMPSVKVFLPTDNINSPANRVQQKRFLVEIFSFRPKQMVLSFGLHDQLFKVIAEIVLFSVKEKTLGVKKYLVKEVQLRLQKIYFLNL
jgi:hypothetical protein